MRPIGSIAVRVRNGWLTDRMARLMNEDERSAAVRTFALGVLVGELAVVTTLTAGGGSGVTTTDAISVAGAAVAVLAWTRLPGPARRAQ